jgi:hypothetical protein
MNLCLVIGAKQTLFATTAFTLVWTHSVEKTSWSEDWRLTPQGLVIIEARIEGSGAGMDPPPDAVFDGRYWRYRPDLPPQPSLHLARSGATGSSWAICFSGTCHPVPEAKGKDEEPALLEPCP